MSRIIRSAVFISGLLLVTGFGAKGQEMINAAGGNASGSGGNVSYSLGQIAYSYAEGSSGAVLEGIQQAFEIYSTGIGSATGDPGIRVYPSPATSSVTLDLGLSTSVAAGYQLSDIIGKLIISGTTTGSKTNISLQALPPATYLLLVTEDTQRIQSFKIIKNN